MYIRDNWEKDPVHLKETIKEIERDLGIGRDMYLIKDIIRSWEAITGKSLSQRTRPVSLREGILTIRVFEGESSAFKTEIKMEADRIKENTRKITGLNIRETRII